jgi:multidrug efflux pump
MSTDLFVERPVVALVLSLLIVLLGGLGWHQLGLRETPDVDLPVVTVNTSWPGADPAVVETGVTEVLERELNGIEGVRTLSSSSQDGRSEITIEFELSRDLEAAANDVRSRVARARRRLPDEVDEPVVDNSDANAQPTLFLRIAVPGLELPAIAELADTVVRDRLESVTGVSALDVSGSSWAMRVDLDGAAMASRGVTLADITAALDRSNVDLPVGRIEGDTVQLTMHLAGGLHTPEEFAALALRTDGDTVITLDDVADVRLGAENERTASRADGVPTVMVTITPQARANVVGVSDEVRRRLPDVEAALPSGATVDVVYDRAEAVRASLADVGRTLGIALVLVILVIGVFLRDVRSTLVPSIAIPVSLIGTFLVLWLAGFTINVFTLFGLVLAIGLVVDDAIVVLENVVRHVEDGLPPVEAALVATRQIARAVIGTTLVLVVVFLPVLFAGGATGRLFLEFGTAVAASVLISMVVALTLTPMLASRVVRAHPHAGEGRLERWFAASLAGVMRRPWVVGGIVLLALAAGGLGLWRVPREFFPIEDRGTFTIRVEAPEGATFEWTDAQVAALEARIAPLVPERTMMLTRVATGRGGSVGAVNSASIQLPLVPVGERDRSQQDIVAALKGMLAQEPALRAIPTQSPTIGRGSASPLQFVLQDPDFDALAAELPKFAKAVKGIPGLSGVNVNLKLDRPELRLDVDRRKAELLGVSLREVARTLEVLTGGVQIARFKRGVREFPVVAGLVRGERDEPADLDGLVVSGRDGTVPIGTLLDGDEQVGAATRYHYGRQPAATISANLDGITLGQAVSAVQQLADQQLPPGFATALAGESKDYAEGASTLTQMFGLALLLVYLLLSAQFDSFVAPIAILLAVPLAMAGALGALWITGSTLSFFAQVGLILLVGLVTKNGILIVEYARQLEHGEGLGPWDAAAKAAKLRLRPIVMTSVATIGGAAPIALGFSGAARSALGIAVVGGVGLATVLTLYVTPVVYAATARKKQA